MVKNKLIRFVLAMGSATLALLLSSCQGVALLDPKGPVGEVNRDLLLIALGLGFLVVIPVIAMTIWFALRYRESNKTATYKPHWEGSLKIEAVIWLVPIAIIVVLSYLTWVYTTSQDPYKPIASTEKPLHVQVISTDWNWVFLYPEQGVAQVNKLVLPVGVPVTFDMTSAAVMSSLFIPDLGSQMYIMAGMVSHLNLLASKPGTFTGKNMEYSGSGYNKMHFQTLAVSSDEFAKWVAETKASTSTLSWDQFRDVSKPREDYPVTSWGSYDPQIFNKVVGLFMVQNGDGTSKGLEPAKSTN
jgi:cytochrome o ubiquinol oxidase subunit 2